MKYTVLLSLLCMLVTPVIRAQSAQDIVVSEVLRADEFLGKSAETIRKSFGQPDDVGVDAEVWTYILRSPADEGVVLGYRQFGFWGDTVAGYSMRWFSSENKAAALYDATLRHLGAGGHTVGMIGGGKDQTIFSENLRISRRGDNFWYADMSASTNAHYVAMLVAEMQYKGGFFLMASEGQRVVQGL